MPLYDVTVLKHTTEKRLVVERATITVAAPDEASARQLVEAAGPEGGIDLVVEEYTTISVNYEDTDTDVAFTVDAAAGADAVTLAADQDAVPDLFWGT